ncbi:hypothetical protein PBRA_008545 [Plasmodiophora brassicae]|uniref:Uncharacterized protein n=1 Tax=Plasmodiophora brassicae TaxID=37360 RepID=A0A0G4J1Z1_PLABS|nr:hypothetical protein PBRA_008545 [Plasmodiophora brassicae]
MVDRCKFVCVLPRGNMTPTSLRSTIPATEETRDFPQNPAAQLGLSGSGRRGIRYSFRHCNVREREPSCNSRPVQMKDIGKFVASQPHVALSEERRMLCSCVYREDKREAPSPPDPPQFSPSRGS